MTRPTRFGATLPQIKRTWSETSAAAQEFDALGFDSLWVCDHLYGVPIPTLPILEGWTLLSAIAAITERAKLGTLVTPPFFRNPAVLANQIATIDQIAKGRVIAGLGGGWFPPEFEQTGCSFPSTRERLRALEEMVEIMKRMWSEEKATYEGRYFSVKEALCEPKPEIMPEILIGGSGEKILMGIAAKHADTWNNMAVHQAALPQKIEALHKRCEEIGRDPASIEISQQCVVVIAEDDEGARASLEKAKKVYGGHMGGAIEEHGIWGTPNAVIDRIEKHRALGVSLFVIEFFGRDTREPARLFAEKVAPAFA
ncbi:MAG TPA: LLM class flavin-dependent oxidoreductase [Myxococcales bacterium]|nr:LLM class flavin-dependent oxidoreductase [Myxococcales bacterium]